MSALWKELGVIIAALSLIAAATRGFGDRGVLASPPEAVAEEFATKLIHGRFGPARSHLAARLARTTTIDSLRAAAARLDRGGTVTEIEGEPGFADGDTARPLVLVIGNDRDTLTAGIPVAWERGTWKIAELGRSMLGRSVR